MDFNKFIVKNWKITDILGLTYLKGLNGRIIREIVDSFESYSDFKNTRKNAYIKLIQENIFGDKEVITSSAISEQLELCEKSNIKIVSIWDNEYPSLLAEIPYPPVILFVKGQLYPDSNSISIVGTRKCTQYGKLATEHFANAFAAQNIIVTSGLAYGIDTQAHLAAMRSNGITYAVIASGIDEIMPAESKKTANKIIDSGGAIISEYRCGIKALPAFFPQRNRIISGISIATLVVESGIKGGSLITARFAFDQGREVFAVPGYIFSEKSEGTNMLINQNIAQVAVSSDSVLKSLGFKTEMNNVIFEQKILDELTPVEERILSNISHEPLHIDMLLELTGIEMSVLLVRVLEMEFKGIIKQLPGKYYIRAIS